MKDVSSQNAAIKAALLNGEIITPLDALNRFNCFRLSARIYDIRHQFGLNIQMLPHPDKRYAQYWCTREDIDRFNGVSK